MMQLMHAHGTAQGESMYIRMKVTAQNIESLLHGEALSNRDRGYFVRAYADHAPRG